MQRKKISYHLWIIAFAVVFTLLASMVSVVSIDASEEGIVTEEVFKFEVSVTTGSLGSRFYVPTSGGLNPDNGGGPKYGKSYAWNIDWGDNSGVRVYTQADSVNAESASGIAHTYSKAGTYCITITPSGSEDAWLAAFGFANDSYGANESSNKGKVVKVISPLTSKMTRTQDQLVKGEVPSYEWGGTFYGCNNLTMGSAFNMPQELETVGDFFAYSMFSGCTGSNFTMSDAFTMPQNLTVVGGDFATFMFYGCTGSSFTMGSVFNMPQKITTVGTYFADRMFKGCTGNSFTMGPEFNMPQELETVEDYFAYNMFCDCTGSSFTMGDAFNLPQKITTTGKYFASSIFAGCTGDSFMMGSVFNIPQELTTVGDSFAYSMFNNCTGSSFTMSDAFTMPQNLETAGTYFASRMFSNCTGNSFTMGKTFTMPQNLVTAKMCFADNMFYNCSGRSFTMGDAFTMPQSLTTVEIYFAYSMFKNCTGNSFTMGDVFNLPKNLKTVGTYFAAYMFNGCTGSSFTMGNAFNLPQNLTAANSTFDNFASYMFLAGGGESFQVNDVFTFPTLLNIISTNKNSFTETFKLSDKTPVQKRLAKSILNGRGNTSDNRKTFDGCNKIFMDYSYLYINWGGGGMTQPTYKLGINVDQYTYKGLGAGYTEQQLEEMVLYVYNLGTSAIGNLTVTLTGGNHFVISAGTNTSIAAGSVTEFRVRPKTNLGVGHYTDSISIKADNVETAITSISCRVIQMPVINKNVQQPEKKEIAIGAASTTLRVEMAAIADGGTLTYQWYRNTSESTIGGIAIEGANDSTYTPATATAGTFYYYVKITNKHEDTPNYEAASTVSKTAMLQIYIPKDAETPKITTHPENMQVLFGVSTTLNVTVGEVTDGGTLSYQWYKNTVNSNIGGIKISGATDSSYTPATNNAGTWYFYVVITNTNNNATINKTANTTSDVAELKVLYANTETPEITAQPKDAKLELGENAKLSVTIREVTDGGTLSYQWYKNDKINNTGGTQITGATSSSYTPETDNAGTYYYYVEIKNTNENAIIKTATKVSDSVAVIVNPKDISNASVIVTGTYTYTGSSIRPKSEDVSVMFDGKTLPQDGSAYTYEVSKGTEAGTAVLIVTGKGNYTNEVKGSFLIDKKGITIDAGASMVEEKIYDGTTDAKLLTVAFTGLINGETLVRDQDYSVSGVCYNSKNVTEANTVTAAIALKEDGNTAKNYRLVNGSFQKSAKILPYSMDGLNHTMNVKSKMNHDYEYDLEQFLPQKADTAQIKNYGAVIENNTTGILSNVTVNGQKLTLSVADTCVEGDTASVKISFESNNYAITDAYLYVQVTDKTPVSISDVTVKSRSYNGEAVVIEGTPKFTNIITGAKMELTPVYQWSKEGVLMDTGIPMDAGNYTLIVTTEDDEGYEVTPLEISFTINKATQTITFPEPDINRVGQHITLKAMADSGLAVTYTSSDETKADVENGVLTLKKTGTVIITAEQTGNNNYNPAECISHTLIIQPVLSSDSRLSNLSVSSGSLTPTFNPSVLEYTLTVSTETASIEVTASANDEKALVSGTGKKDIPIGISTLTIQVTAEDGTKTSYIIRVTRQAAKDIQEYNISYYLNGGSNNNQNPNNYQTGTEVTLKEPTRAGYTFAGWYSDSAFKSMTTGITKDSTGNKDFYAKWRVNIYRITFQTVGGSISQKTKTVTYQSVYGNLPTPKRQGYTFSGWYTGSIGGSKVTSSTKFTATNAQTLYARWSKVSVMKVSIKKVVRMKKKAKITLKKVTGASGYQIVYATNAKMKKSKKAITLKTTLTLKKGNIYYIKVRAYKLDSTGKKVYGAYSGVKRIKINK